VVHAIGDSGPVVHEAVRSSEPYGLCERDARTLCAGWRSSGEGASESAAVPLRC
jgi:hypothetical protein